jgi:hypothetical protein
MGRSILGAATGVGGRPSLTAALTVGVPQVVGCNGSGSGWANKGTWEGGLLRKRV